MSDGPVLIKVWVECGLTMDEDVIEVPRVYWNSLSPEERQAYATDCAVTHQSNVAPCGSEVIE